MPTLKSRHQAAMRNEERPEITCPGIASPLCEAGPLGPHKMSLSVVTLESMFYVLGAFSTPLKYILADG